MINKREYKIFQDIGYLIINRDYKPAEFELFQSVSNYIGPKMEEYEKANNVDRNGSKDEGNV